MSSAEPSDPSRSSRRTVVLAYDGSAAARQAVVEASDILGPSRLLIVTVWDPGLAFAGATMPAADGMIAAPMIDPSSAIEVEHGLHEHAESVSQEGAKLARARGVEAQPLAVPEDGNIASTILAIAQDTGACAIVVGSRGLSGIRARIEGSTSRGLLKHARCPVLVIHEPETNGS